jgi:hypothetical protein
VKTVGVVDPLRLPLALAAPRSHAYRAEKRNIVFQALPHIRLGVFSVDLELVCDVTDDK